MAMSDSREYLVTLVHDAPDDPRAQPYSSYLRRMRHRAVAVIRLEDEWRIEVALDAPSSLHARLQARQIDLDVTTAAGIEDWPLKELIAV
jgi:hypothetical protein